MRLSLRRIGLSGTQPLIQTLLPSRAVAALQCAAPAAASVRSPLPSLGAGVPGAIRSQTADYLSSRHVELDNSACFDAICNRSQLHLPALALSAVPPAPCLVPEQLAASNHVAWRQNTPQDSAWHPLVLMGNRQWCSSASPPPASAASSPPCHHRHSLSYSAFSSLPSHPLGTPSALLCAGPQLPLVQRSRSSSNPPSRSLASTSLPPGAMGQQRQLKIFVQSPGMLADPYKPPPPPLPFLKRWFSLEGWKRIREGIMDSLRTGYAIALLRRNTKGYTRQGFYAEIVHAYSKINKALAADDRTSLRHYVTERAFSTMKTQLKQRSQAGIDHADWKLGSGVPSISTLQARLVALDKNKPENSFIQVTLKINSKQVVAVYDRKGKLCGGDPSKEIDVEDVWVFERHLLQPEAQWRLCGQLAKGPA